MTTAYINRIVTALPPFDVYEHVVEYTAGHFEDPANERVFRRMVRLAGINHRWAVMPDFPAFFGQDINGMRIGSRMREFEQHAAQLAVDAVDRLGLGSDAAAITHLITVTNSGWCAPGFDLAILDRCGIPSSVERTQLTFMGCFAGLTALKLAHHIVRSEPGARVLIVALETASLHMRQAQDLETALSRLLFGDGCAAAVVSAEETGFAVESFTATVTPGTRDLMKLSVGDTSAEMVLSGQVPLALGRALKDERTRKLVLCGAEPDDIDLWAIHPGGRSILDAVGGALELGSEHLAPAREVLSGVGNLAAAAIFFVLEKLLHQNGTGETGCALAFGPGIAIESMRFRRQ